MNKSGQFKVTLVAVEKEQLFIVMRDNEGIISFPYTVLTRDNSDPASNTKLWEGKLRKWAEDKIGLNLTNENEWGRVFDVDKHGFIYICRVKARKGWTAQSTDKGQFEYTSASTKGEKQEFKLVDRDWMSTIPKRQLRGRRWSRYEKDIIMQCLKQANNAADQQARPEGRASAVKSQANIRSVAAKDISKSHMAEDAQAHSTRAETSKKSAEAAVGQSTTQVAGDSNSQEKSRAPPTSVGIEIQKEQNASANSPEVAGREECKEEGKHQQVRSMTRRITFTCPERNHDPGQDKRVEEARMTAMHGTPEVKFTKEYSFQHSARPRDETKLVEDNEGGSDVEGGSSSDRKAEDSRPARNNKDRREKDTKNVTVLQVGAEESKGVTVAQIGAEESKTVRACERMDHFDSQSRCEKMEHFDSQSRCEKSPSFAPHLREIRTDEVKMVQQPDDRSESDEEGERYTRVAQLSVGYQAHPDILAEAYNLAKLERGVNNDQLIHFNIKVRALKDGWDDELVMQLMAEREKPRTEQRTSAIVTEEEKSHWCKTRNESQESSNNPSSKGGRRGFSIEEASSLKKASLRALKDSGASPSLCHSHLAKELGLTKLTREEALRMKGAFDSAQGTSEYVVMVVIVHGYREEFREPGSESWCRTSGGDNPPPGMEIRRVDEERKFIMHAELCDSIFVQLLLGQNVNVDNNIVARTDENRSSFFRGEDVIFVPHDQRPKRKGQGAAVKCVEIEDVGEAQGEGLIRVCSIDMEEEAEVNNIDWISTWRRADRGHQKKSCQNDHKDSAEMIDRVCQSTLSSGLMKSWKVLTNVNRIRTMLGMLGLDHVYRWLPRRVERWFSELKANAKEGKLDQACELLGRIDIHIVKGHVKEIKSISEEGFAEITEDTLCEWYAWFLDELCPEFTLGYHAAEGLFRTFIHQSIHSTN